MHHKRKHKKNLNSELFAFYKYTFIMSIYNSKNIVTIFIANG